MGKHAIEGKRADGYTFDPNELVIITDKRHPLYDSREALPVERGDVLDVAIRGVIEPIGVRKVDDENVVLFGKQRTKMTAVANALGAAQSYTGTCKAVHEAVKEFGEDEPFVKQLVAHMKGRALRVPAVARNSGEDKDARLMMRAENAHRRGDETVERIRWAQEAHEKFGETVEEIAQAENVDPKTVARWLKADVSNGRNKPKRTKAKGPGKPQIKKWHEHKEIGDDYRTLFGWLIGANSKDEMLKENPDLTGIV